MVVDDMTLLVKVNFAQRLYQVAQVIRSVWYNSNMGNFKENFMIYKLGNIHIILGTHFIQLWSELRQRSSIYILMVSLDRKLRPLSCTRIYD